MVPAAPCPRAMQEKAPSLYPRRRDRPNLRSSSSTVKRSLAWPTHTTCPSEFACFYPGGTGSAGVPQESGTQ